MLAGLVTEEMGCPISQSLMMQATDPRIILDTFLELAPQYPFSMVRRSGTASALVTREPVGVVAAVVPWNTPQSVSIMKLAPALLCGCTVVLKPAPETPLDAYLLAEMLQSAGLPAGVVNVMPADREVSEYLVTHPGWTRSPSPGPRRRAADRVSMRPEPEESDAGAGWQVRGRHPGRCRPGRDGGVAAPGRAA